MKPADATFDAIDYGNLKRLRVWIRYGTTGNHITIKHLGDNGGNGRKIAEFTIPASALKKPDAK